MLKRRIMGLLLAAAMVVTMLPASALTAQAEEAEPEIAAQDETIYEVGLTGVTAPVADAYPTIEGVTVPAGVHYHIMTDSLQWYNVTDNVWMDETQAFEKGKMYRLNIAFYPDEGYLLADRSELTFALTGFSSDDYFYSIFQFSEKVRTIYCTFPALPTDPVSTVTFDAGGGSGTMESFTVDSGTEITLPECTFDPPEGYCFNRWDKGPAGAKYQVVSDVTITAQWIPIPTGTELTEVGLTGVTVPRIGDHPTVEGITAPGGAHYELLGPGWYNSTDNVWMEDSDVFEEGKIYQLNVTFYANEGYYFADAGEMTFALEGVPADDYHYSLYSFGEIPYTSKTVYCVFGPLEPETVDDIVLNSGPLPVIDQTLSIADFGLSVPAGSGYYIEEALWNDVATDTYSAEMTFAEGKTYWLVIGLLPENGYVFASGEDVTAELADILGVRYRPLGNYNLSIHGTAGGLLVAFEFTPRASWVSFSDVTDPSQFYFDAVYWLADRGVINGWSDGTFRPLNTCNRASVMAFLYRLAGSPAVTHPAESPFSDVPESDQFYDAILWGVQQGITNGWPDGTFRPWNTCNRATIVTFLWRFAHEPEPAAPAPFSDMTGNEEFDRAIAWAAEQGITTGWPDGTFRPWNDCNRLSVVSFLYRYALLAGIE